MFNVSENVYLFVYVHKGYVALLNLKFWIVYNVNGHFPGFNNFLDYMPLFFFRGLANTLKDTRLPTAGWDHAVAWK